MCQICYFVHFEGIRNYYYQTCSNGICHHKFKDVGILSILYTFNFCINYIYLFYKFCATAQYEYAMRNMYLRCTSLAS